MLIQFLVFKDKLHGHPTWESKSHKRGKPGLSKTFSKQHKWQKIVEPWLSFSKGRNMWSNNFIHRQIIFQAKRQHSQAGKNLGLIGEGNGTPLQYSCLENPMDGGAWWAAVHGVAKGQTQLRNFTFTFHFHALEKEMATHSSVLAWRISGTREPGGLPSMGSHRVGHDWSDLAAAAGPSIIALTIVFVPNYCWTNSGLPTWC